MERKEIIHKIQRGGGKRPCFQLTLPMKWCKELGLESGDYVVISFENGSLRITKLRKEGEDHATSHTK